MDSRSAKIGGIIALGLGTLVVGLLPAWFSSHSRQWPLLLSSLLCFGGGVLLSTSMIHILPELREVTTHAELLFCAGFFLLYLIDELVHFLWPNRTQSHDNHSHNIYEEHGSRGHMRSSSLGHTRNKAGYGSIESSALLAKSESNLYTRQAPYNPSAYRVQSQSDLCCDNRPPSQVCHVNHTEPCHDPPVGQMGLLIALSLHATLEGLAIGLENSTSKVWLLVGAVASHKLVVGFCLGVELSSGVGTAACKHFVAIAVFALGSVAGIVIGMTVTGMSSHWSDVAQPILQGLAGGTLLYVTVCEVLPRERARWHNQSACPAASLIQYFSVAIGFTATTLITKYLEFDHVSP
ncbi:Zinc/iron regulated transporter-related protein 88E [Carabus blaptoides fortunei]